MTLTATPVAAECIRTGAHHGAGRCATAPSSHTVEEDRSDRRAPLPLARSLRDGERSLNIPVPRCRGRELGQTRAALGLERARRYPPRWRSLPAARLERRAPSALGRSRPQHICGAPEIAVPAQAHHGRVRLSVLPSRAHPAPASGGAARCRHESEFCDAHA